MDITTYRGYSLHLGETVDIYWGRDRVDEAPDLATATQRIDEWLSAP
jgi:hypothetical protein